MLEKDAIDFCNRNPNLSFLLPDIKKVCDMIIRSFSDNGTLYVCGNGGSYSDALHISGELLKSFEKDRGLNDKDKAMFSDVEFGNDIASKLEYGFPTVVLGDNGAFSSAYSNDVDSGFIYAQHLFAMRPSKSDIFIGISTSGNSPNIRYAASTAKALSVPVISLTGPKSNPLEKMSDISILIPGSSTFEIQENTLPIYHLICKSVEAYFY